MGMGLATARAAIAGVPPLDWVLRLTLLLMLLRTPEGWLIRPAVLLLAGAGLVAPPLMRRPPLWAALALLTAAATISHWPLADNHAYLLVYWCLAICIALASADPAGSLSPNARLLIGLPFALAVLWKVGLSRDYLDGTFFRVTLLDDPRFEAFTRLLAGIGPELLEHSREALRQHVDGSIATVSVPALPQRFHRVALALTWWGLAIEGLVALAFLWPGRVARASRDTLLLVFCASTYAVANVPGFGWLLTIMGLAQCRPEAPGYRVAYVGAFVLILLYTEMLWSAVLL